MSTPNPFALTINEKALVDQIAAQVGQKPEDYVAVDVNLQQAGPVAVQIMQTPQGMVEMAVVPFALMLPVANLQAPRILLPGQQSPDPLSGLIPLMHARLIVPRQRFRGEIVEAIEKASDQASKAPPLPTLRGRTGEAK